MRSDPWGAEIARRRTEIRNQKNENAQLKRELNELLKVQGNAKIEKLSLENQLLRDQNKDSHKKVKEMQR